MIMKGKRENIFENKSLWNGKDDVVEIQSVLQISGLVIPHLEI